MIKTLLFVVNVDWFFISHRMLIAQEAIRMGYAVHIATGLTDRRQELEHAGLVVHPLAFDRSSASLWNTADLTFQLWRVFRTVRPDIVHLITIKSVLLGGVVGRLAAVPAMVAAISGLGYVFVARGYMAQARLKVVGMLYRLALGHENLAVIFQNPDDLGALSKIASLPQNKVTTIRGSGVDLERFAAEPLPLGIPVVVMAARLLKDKGLHEFVQAARLLKQRGCIARFALIGSMDPDNPSSITRPELEAWVSDDIVEWWGHRSDMPSALAAANIVVLPSYREGLPKVLLEAASCGRAVITTDVPGCRDAIDPNVTGSLVPVRDASALANAIQALVNNPERCKTMGEAGRMLAERAFDVRQVVNAHMTIYQRLLEKL